MAHSASLSASNMSLVDFAMSCLSIFWKLAPSALSMWSCRNMASGFSSMNPSKAHMMMMMMIHIQIQIRRQKLLATQTSTALQGGRTTKGHEPPHLTAPQSHRARPHGVLVPSVTTLTSTAAASTLTLKSVRCSHRLPGSQR